MDIRISCGSEKTLGLRKLKTSAQTNMVYLMTKGICKASCKFCSQSLGEENNYLSRIKWNVWKFEDIVSQLQGQKRVCIQCLNYPEVYEDLLEMVKKINSPISISAQPLTIDKMRNLSQYIEYLSISLDCFSKEIFEKYKPYYNWDLHWARMKKAVDIFGEGKVISHLIVGLGENEREIVSTLYKLIRNNITPSLFAFTPLKNIVLENMVQPDIGKYRRAQIARHLLTTKQIRPEEIEYENDRIISFGTKLENLPKETFMTQGCPNCNRPFYNEIPGGTIYNYPYEISEKTIIKLIEQAEIK